MKEKTNPTSEIQAAMQALYERNGGELTASSVLKEATPPDSPLHPKFEWDDKKAAHEHRLKQARNLIRDIKIISVGRDEPERLIHIPTIDRGETSEGTYKTRSVIVQSKTDFQLALEAAIARLNSAQRAVDELRAASHDDDTLSKIMLAYEALNTANTALSAVH